MMHIFRRRHRRRTQHEIDDGPTSKTCSDVEVTDVTTENSQHTTKERKAMTISCMQSLKNMFTSHLQIFFISVGIFLVLCGAGITLCLVLSNTDDSELERSIIELAEETGKFFSNELDVSLLPLFSMAQLATELEIFSNLPGMIGAANEPGSLPFLPQVGALPLKRNITGVCDNTELIHRFNAIASAAERNTGIQELVHSIQYSPYGVICLMYPYNNSEDFTQNSGLFLDSGKAIGVDLLNDQSSKYIAIKSITNSEIMVSISGPKIISQCVECGLYIVARLPVQSDTHSILVNGSYYPRWGFATVLVQWENLVTKSRQREKFQELGHEFQITRTDRVFNDTSLGYDKVVVVLAKSDHFGSKSQEVHVALQTSNNEWDIVVQYDLPTHHRGLVIALTVILSFFISALVYIVLVQKQMNTIMTGQNLTQLAKVEIERNMTAYFAHELRNPLSSIDSALLSMPCTDPKENDELLKSMKLCSAFMSSIMNNLLDVRKLEEGMLELHYDPMSISEVVQDIGSMARPTVRPEVTFDVRCDTGNRDWILGDNSRIKQILTNIVSNAIKFTLNGSVTLAAFWDDDMVQFECQDTGPGIPKEEQSRMFERFTRRGGAPGSGLGLALAKQLVALMSGTIHFESDPKTRLGTVCIVRLPLIGCDTPVVKSSAIDAQPLDAQLRILIVDDIKMNRCMLKRRLKNDIAPFCDIFEASTAEEAISLCEESKYDIIIMDQYMEDAGGVLVGTDAILSLRRMNVQSIIVGCSGNDMNAEFISAGADLVWSKPMPSNADIIMELRMQLQSHQVPNGRACNV